MGGGIRSLTRRVVVVDAIVVGGVMAAVVDVVWVGVTVTSPSSTASSTRCASSTTDDAVGATVVAVRL